MTISYGPKLGLMVNGAQGEEHYLPLMKMLRAIDALVQLNVISHTLGLPPGSPNDGDCYIVGSTASGDWAGYAGRVARYSTLLTGWEFYTPKQGWIAWSDEAGEHLKYVGGAWVALSTGPVLPPAAPLVGALGSITIDDVTEFNPGRTATAFGSGGFYTSGLVWGNSRSSGQRYFEMRLQSSITSPANFIAGLQTQSLIDNFNEAAHGIGAYVWNGGVFRMDSKFYALDGSLVLDGSGPAGVLASYDLLCIAVDLDAGKLWYRINDGSWFGGGDPELGTGGITISAGGVALRPVMAVLEHSLQVAISTTADWVSRTVPAGFVCWDD